MDPRFCSATSTPLSLPLARAAGGMWLVYKFPSHMLTTHTGRLDRYVAGPVGGGFSRDFMRP
jgi:hypothetical protein